MRVLMLQNGIPPYWIPRLKALNAFDDLELVLATNSGGELGRPDEALPNLRVEWHPLSSKALEAISFLSLVPKTIALIRRTMPDVAYLAGMNQANGIAAHIACRMFGIPIIGMSESTAFDARSTSGIRGQAKGLFKRWLLSMVDIMMVPGTRAYEHLRSLGVPDAKLMQSGYASNTPELRQKSLALSATELRAKLSELGLPEAGYLLFVGRFTWVKNLPMLIEAYAKLRQQMPDAPPLVLVGDGPDRQELEALAKKLGVFETIVFAGYKTSEELFFAYSGAKALLLPSKSETWGMVVNEAMACGTPVVASTRVGASADLVEDGESGWLVDPDDIESICRGLSAVLRDDRDLKLVRELLWEKVQEHSPARFAETFYRACRAALYHHGRIGSVR